MHEFLKKADNITELEKCRVKENGYGYNLLLVFLLRSDNNFSILSAFGDHCDFMINKIF